MDELIKSIQQFFDRLDTEQETLSMRWRLHTNRRTLIVLVAAGIVSVCGYIYFVSPPDNFPLNSLVTVPPGESVKEVSSELQKRGVIRSAFAFRIVTSILGHEHDLHAGDYIFKEPEDIFSVARAIGIGQYGLEPLRIRIPEGATTKEMALIYSSRLERFNRDNFLIQAQPQEGFLFPDTYFFLPNATEDIVFQAMRQNFDQRIQPLLPAISSSTHSIRDIVIMASLLEREARNSHDRQMISGVLWNRIARKMPLQVDVSFLYTLGKGTFQLTMKDLTTDSPYNTYKNKGLPPGAIGSPSLDSLSAAVNPIKNDFIFFLADRTGVTHFCKTYSCQLSNKYLYF